jgi:DnaJ-class molecular chaperone
MNDEDGLDDLYALLGVRRTASGAEIKSAYRKMAIKLHPDRNKSPDADEQFKLINRAHSILSDQNLRNIYDREGARGVRAAETRAARDEARRRSKKAVVLPPVRGQCVSLLHVR